MTRAHVPPQAAGNRGMVTSATVRIHNRIRSTGRPTAGGMWLRGLCGDGNSLAGANYDTAYGDFAIAEDVQRHLPHGGSDHHVLGLAEGLLAMFQHTIDERLTDPDAATPATPRATGRHS